MTYEFARSKCRQTIYSGFEPRCPDDILKSSGYRCRVNGAVPDPKSFKVEVVRQEGLAQPQSSRGLAGY